ncbi:MAG: transcription antitermination factor NusB [Candidatus Cloacimonadia bacterium]
MGPRREARELAVQVIYALELNGYTSQEKAKDANLDQVIEDIISIHTKKLTQEQKEFIDFLVKRTYYNLPVIDELIRKFSKNWPFHRISIVDKSILRLAIMEMLFSETPAQVVINEAIEISKKFSGEKSGTFINGVLDTVMHYKEKYDTM